MSNWTLSVLSVLNPPWDRPKILFCHLDDPSAPHLRGGGEGEIFNILRYNKTLNTAHKVLKISPPQNEGEKWQKVIVY